MMSDPGPETLEIEMLRKKEADDEMHNG